MADDIRTTSGHVTMTADTAKNIHSNDQARMTRFADGNRAVMVNVFHSGRRRTSPVESSVCAEHRRKRQVVNSALLGVKPLLKLLEDEI